jgi:hypothetical protein
MNIRIRERASKPLLRLAVYVPTIVVLLVAGVLFTARSSSAADECIVKPNAPAPQGSHWYYRVDRVNKRQCWYVAAEGPKVRAPARETASRVPTPAAKPAMQTASEQSVDEALVDGAAAAAEKTPLAVASLTWQGLPTSAFSSGDGILLGNADTQAAPESRDDSAKPASAAGQVIAEQPAEPAFSLGSLLAVLAGALGLAAAIGYAIMKLAASPSKRCHPARVASKPAQARCEAPEKRRRTAAAPDHAETSPATQPSDRGMDIEATLSRLLHELEQRHGELTGAHIRAQRPGIS